jgi:putative transposase
MPGKFRNRYRIFSNRLQNWNYGWNASCFVTICTQGRECYFGRVLNGKMELSGTGISANVLWCEITNHSKNIELGEFVVMPNHVHGILILNGNNDANVETTHALSLQSHQFHTPEKRTKRLDKTGFKTKGKIPCRQLLDL